MPKLTLKDRETKAEKSFTFDREEIVIGRSNTSNIILDARGVSRRHAKIFPEGKDFYIIDLGSTGGTRLNSILIPKNEKYILKNSDIINIDKYDIQFLSADDVLNQSLNEITDSDILEVKLLKKVLAALDKESIPSIEVLNGVAEGKKAYFTEDLTEITIGRDSMCEFPIEEYVVSRKHAKISKKWGGIVIQDLGSKNGVYVNNKKVTEEFLHDGDRIALGTIVLMFRNPKEVDIEEIKKHMTKEKKAPPLSPSPKKEESPAPAEEAKEEASETSAALPEEVQEKLVQKVKKAEYPIPHPRRQRIKFGLIELGFIGIGVLIFAFAIVMIIKIIFGV